MTWDNETCDDCAAQTSGGPMLRDEVWATITTPYAVVVPWVPDQPDQLDLFPLFQQVETFLCFGCIERRLGRQLTQEDLNTSVWNAGWIDYVCDIKARPGETPEMLQALQASLESAARRWARGRRLLPHSKCAREGDQ